MSQKLFLSLAAIVIAVTLSACATGQVDNTQTNASPATSVTPVITSTQMANPASVNCEKQGGTLLLMDKIVDGKNLGQYGICYFEDNRQCEEWAMLRGDCPVGGFKITGYATPAAVFCAITGGTYAIAQNKKAAEISPDQEQGICTLKNGKICDVWKYYKGECPTE